VPAAATTPPRAALVLLAAGEGRRARQHINKVLLPLAGRQVFTWSIRWARLLPSVVHTVLVVREEDRSDVLATIDREVGPPEIDVVVGGDTRHASEWAALRSLEPRIRAGEIDVVVIHDAARPLATSRLFAQVIDAAAEHGGAIPVREQRGLAGLDGIVVPEDTVVTVQTPQAFAAVPLLDAYRRADAEGFVGTDTASCVEHFTDVGVICVVGDARNIKITFPDDLFLAERLLARADHDLSGGLEHPPAGRLRDLWHHGTRPRSHR
jgi:2-C-methyl-D-erythritol 4-phosphate cytidylyltransferase